MHQYHAIFFISDNLMKDKVICSKHKLESCPDVLPMPQEGKSFKITGNFKEKFDPPPIPTFKIIGDSIYLFFENDKGVF